MPPPLFFHQFSTILSSNNGIFYLFLNKGLWDKITVSFSSKSRCFQ
jgi:hypothetical protein